MTRTAASILTSACLQLEGLDFARQRNPYNPRAPICLYLKTELLEKAHAKFGGADGFAAEKKKRKDRKARKAALPATKQQRAAAADADADVAMLPAELVEPIGAAQLRPLLAERVRIVYNDGDDEDDERGEAAAIDTNGPVLYWVNTALRAHENPALEVAAREAAARGVSLRLAAFFLDATPHLNARRLTFALEGAADMQDALAKLDVDIQLEVQRLHSMQLCCNVKQLQAPHLQ